MQADPPGPQLQSCHSIPTLDYMRAIAGLTAQQINLVGRGAAYQAQSLGAASHAATPARYCGARPRRHTHVNMGRRNETEEERAERKAALKASKAAKRDERQVGQASWQVGSWGTRLLEDAEQRRTSRLPFHPVMTRRA